MPKVDLQEFGATGLNRQGGVVYEEFLRELQGVRWIKAVKEMSEQDAVIGAILFAIEMLIRQATWRVGPASDDKDDEEAATFVDSCLHDMSSSWTDTINERLSFLAYGWEYGEIVYKIRGGDHRDPKRRSKFNDGRIGWRKWPTRAQDTLDEWDFDEEGGIQGLWQSPPPDWRVRHIPIEKALLFRTTTKKGNPEGRSILRNAYRSWYFGKNIENVEGVGIERDLAGLPVAYVPPELLAATATAAQKAILATIKEIVTNIRRDAQEGVVWPMAYDDNGRLLYDLKLLSSGGSRQFDTDKIVRRYNQNKAMTVLADFILVGHDQHGSFSLHSSKTNLFTVAIGAYLDNIAGVINEHAIPRLLRLNGMKVTAMPKLVHGDIETVDLMELADYISKLAGTGYPLWPNEELGKHLLELANLPAGV